jgi:hypothetical protein
MPTGRAANESVRSAAVQGATESEIAAVAYQLWLANGRPAGSDKEDWFRAEEALKEVRRDACTATEVLLASRCWGHWEVWEMEWGDPRWVWD